MKLPPPRSGDLLRIKDRELEFSFYPMVRSNRRWGIHSTLYAADPWGVIEGSVTQAISAPNDKKAAASFVRQAREYFSAAERATSIETPPLLYYYSFLNLAKAIAMGRGRPDLVGRVHHGIGHVGGSRTAHTPSGAVLKLDTSNATRKSAIDELHWALEGRSVAAGEYPVSAIIPQSVIAHRMWREAFEPPRKEKFIPVDKIQFMQDASSNCIWLSAFISRTMLRSHDLGIKKVLKEANLDSTFEVVQVQDAEVANQYHMLQQRTPVPYSGRAADVVVDTVELIRPALWQTVTVNAPYRRFYLYLSPGNEARMPQWLSIYATIFWLGSLTRYQPVELFDVLNGNYGPFFREFLETQPKQLLYMLASDAKQQNVTRAAIV